MFIRILEAAAIEGSGGEVIRPPSDPQRKLLVLLAIRAGRVVPADTICDLFEINRGALRTAISRLRKTVGKEALVTESPGYVLHAETDLMAFEQLVAAARTKTGRNAVDAWRKAVALFVGPAFGEFGDEPWAVAQATRTNELRAGAVESLASALLGVGDHQGALAELVVHIEQHPYRENPRVLQIEALDRAGRSIEAMRCFQQYRTQLINDVGTEPSAALIALDRSISSGHHKWPEPSSGDLAEPRRAESTTALPDTALPDTALPTATLPDTALPDTALPTATLPDTALPHTAPSEASLHAGGSQVVTRREDDWPVTATNGKAAVLTNLPSLPDTFINRTRELVDIAEALSASRLVTLRGPGGIGKTRLAYRAARDQAEGFPDGVWVVELADCDDVASIVSAISDAVGLPLVSTPARCAELLAGHTTLLILDNCEHLADHMYDVIEPIISGTVRLRVLATSRVRLGIAGERVIEVDPLATDGHAQELFMARAASVGAPVEGYDAAAVNELCAQLDGMPLALELAAAAARVMSPAEMVSRLDDRFELLRDGPRGSVAGRHRSLRMAIESSYDSIGPDEQTLFRRLCVFAADFPMSAVEAAATGLSQSAFTLIGELVDRSLVRVDMSRGRTTYRLLETLRHYGHERLVELDELDQAHECQIAWCFDASAALAAAAFGPDEASSLNQLVSVSANLRLAVSRLLDKDDVDRAGDLVLQVEDFGYASNTLVELVGPLADSGRLREHRDKQRLLAMELIRQSVSEATDRRTEIAAELSAGLSVGDAGCVQLSVLLISTALGVGPGQAFIAAVAARAMSHDDRCEQARLLSAAALGMFYSDEAPEELDVVHQVIAAASAAGMQRVLIPAASVACLGGLRQGRPGQGAALARPILATLDDLPHDSIMTNGLLAMYTECAIQAGMSQGDQLAAISRVGGHLRGDFNRLGLVLARLVQLHGHVELAVRATGACAAAGRSRFSNGQRATILELAAKELTEREIDVLLATGAVSEPTELYREMWATLFPLSPAVAEAQQQNE